MSKLPKVYWPIQSSDLKKYSKKELPVRDQADILFLMDNNPMLKENLYYMVSQGTMFKVKRDKKKKIDYFYVLRMSLFSSTESKLIYSVITTKSKNNGIQYKIDTIGTED